MVNKGIAVSASAQKRHDRTMRLHAQAGQRRSLLARLARHVRQLFARSSRQASSEEMIVASVYGRSLKMPANHSLPEILLRFPQYNHPLAMSVQAIANVQGADSSLTVIDVGANIGDTAAIVEQQLPNVCRYLCIEPDVRLAELCRENHADNSRVQVVQSFIGEDEGARVQLSDNENRANPATKLVVAGEESENDAAKLTRLDTAARTFVEHNGGINLIKVDTEGYDFSVLRSGWEILGKYHPSIFLEWYPELLLDLQETPQRGFHELAELGYVHMVIFTKQGDFYCKISNPDNRFFEALASLALTDFERCYFDVFVTCSEETANALADLYIDRSRLDRAEPLARR
ncbi:MAG: FkbM family methyltransferase [Bryocella sp.]